MFQRPHPWAGSLILAILLFGCSASVEAIGPPLGDGGGRDGAALDATAADAGSADAGSDGQASDASIPPFCNACRVVYTGFVRDYAVDQNNIYVNGLSAAVKVPLDGGSPVPLAENQPNMVSIAADSNRVYWTNDLGDAGSVTAVPIDGGPVTELSSAPGAGTYGLALDSTNAYFTGGVPQDGGVVWGFARVPLDGSGPPVVLLPNGDGPASIFQSGGSLYFTDTNNGVDAVSVDGGPVTELAPPTKYFQIVAVDATSVWVLENVGLVRIPKDGSASQVFSVVPYQVTSSVAVNDTTVFWTNHDAGSVVAMVIDGGAITNIASGQDNPILLTAMPGALYWSANYGSVVQTPIP